MLLPDISDIEAIEARESYFYFLKYVHPVKTFTWNWHHKYVCDILQEFLEGKYKFLMVFMPPQHQKTTMMTEYLSPFAFGHNIDEQIILSMYNSTKASEYNRKVKRIMNSEAYRSIFPNVILPKRRDANFENTSHKFEIPNSQGFFYSVGVDGGIAGTPAKIALMDDVIKNAREAFSKTYRDSIYTWYTDELESRLQNISRVAFTITRRHEDDLAGRLLERDGRIEDGGVWKVVEIPAIKENNDNPDDPREIGEALFPFLHSRERLEKIRDNNPRTWQSLYQQRPAALEGNIFKREWFDKKASLNWKLYADRIRIYIDSAIGKKEENDFSGISIYLMLGRIMYFVKIYRVKLNTHELKKHISEIPTKYGLNPQTTIIYIEAWGTGNSFYDSLKSDPEYRHLRLKPDRKKGSKEALAESYCDYIESEDVQYLEGSIDSEYIEEMCGFPNAKHDDRVDATINPIVLEFGKGGGQGSMSKK